MTDEEKTNEAKQLKKYDRRKGKTRAHGTGSIFQRRDRRGKPWVAQIILEDGKTRQRYFKTQGEAAEALHAMLHELRQGTLITEKDQTVKQLVEHWIENVHRKSVRESTYTEYRKLINNHILPGLGQVKLQRLTIGQVETFYTRKMHEGLSAGTIRLIHGILHQSLSYAVRNNLVARNVCASVKLPRIARSEIEPLTVEQAHTFLEAAQGRHLEALFTLAILTGMREGELLALHWSDIHFEQRSLQVRRTVRCLPGRGLVESEPKTASSRRKIALSPLLLDVLKRHRARQLQARLQAGNAWNDRDLVFCNSTGGPIYPSSLRATFARLLRDGGLPHLRFHDLRHSAATLLLSMGVHAKVVQELLGHSTILLTLNTYSHVLPSLHQDAIEKLSGLFIQEHDQRGEGLSEEQN